MMFEAFGFTQERTLHCRNLSQLPSVWTTLVVLIRTSDSQLFNRSNQRTRLIIGSTGLNVVQSVGAISIVLVSLISVNSSSPVILSTSKYLALVLELLLTIGHENEPENALQIRYVMQCYLRFYVPHKTSSKSPS